MKKSSPLSFSAGICFFLTVVFLAAGYSSTAQVIISNATSTVSTCPNNGTISVTASTTTGTTLLYSIVNGPVTQPDQTSPTFNSLPPGNYTVRVADVMGNSATADVEISGTYTPLNFTTFTSSPSCSGGNDGSISVYRTSGTGFGPFTWEITAPAAYVRPPQASNSFNNLPAGDYTVRLNDACGAFRTLTTKITDAPSDIEIIGSTVNMVGCDTALLKIDLRVNGHSPPYTIQVESNNNPANVIKEEILTSNLPYRIELNETIAGIGFGDDIKLTVTDNCGRTTSIQRTIKSYTFCPDISTTLVNCQFYELEYTNSNINCPYLNLYPTYLNPPVSYELLDQSDGSVAESGTIYTGMNPMYGDNINSVIFKKVEANKVYSVRITDGCGNVFTDTYASPTSTGNTTPPTVSTTGGGKGICVDSTAYLTIRAHNFQSEPSLVFLSGPSSMGSTKEGFEYNYPYTFPDTITPNGWSFNQHNFTITNLAPGTYQYKVIDACGTEVPGTFEIKPENVNSFKHSDNDFHYSPGCLGNNQLSFYLTANGRVTIRNNAIGFHWEKIISLNGVDTVREVINNIPPGTYNASLARAYNGGKNINDLNVNCHEVSEIIEVPQYSGPEILTYNSLLCGNAILAELFPDSSKGVPPYEYEIISGPQTFPRQSGNTFTMSTKGTYIARVYDACGNASTRAITLEEVEFKPLLSNVSCTSARIIYPSSEYYTYTWTKPDGTVFTGDTLFLPAISPADTGNYQVAQTIVISGCQETVYDTHHISIAENYKSEDTICAGESYLLGNQVLNTSGIYRDTLVTALGCDSIVELHLFVKDYLRGTENQTICPGGSTVIAGKTYTQDGTFYDTLTTATCDSIITINISYSNYLTGTVNESICPRGDVLVAGKLYNAQGTYRDTLFTGTCDSILFITISQLDYLRGSVSASFCTGQSVSINGKTYNTPGIYSDTLTTTSCDSVVTIMVSETNYLHGNMYINKCPGQPETVFGKVYTSPGIYADTLATATCDSIVTIEINDLDYKRGSTQIQKCPGTSVTFLGKVYTSPGVYSDTLSTATCDSVLTITISDLPFKRNFISEYLCPGETVTIASKVYSGPGKYYDTLATVTCDSILEIDILAAPVPSVNLGSDKNLCQGDSLILDAGAGYVSYLWNNDPATVNSQTYIARDPGNYQVEVVNNYGCRGGDQMQILNVVASPIVHASNDTTICYGESVLLTASGGIRYLWKPVNEVQPAITVTPLYTSTYQVIAYDANDCGSNAEEVKVSVKPRPLKPLFSDTSLTHCFLEGSVKIGTNWGSSFDWNTGDTLQTITINSPGIYSVNVLDANGCKVNGEIVVGNKCETMIFVPDAFSPNYDGLHDKLEIFGRNFTNFEMRIFNRWGEIIFMTDDPTVMWDGTYRGDLMPVGSYPWVIQYEYLSKEQSGSSGIKRMTGSVTLVR